MDNFLQQLKDILTKDKRLESKDGSLLKNKAKELAYKNDEKLIKSLLSNKKAKDRFFEEIDESLVFNTNKFVEFLDYKDFLEDSYTKFKNDIGLQIGDEQLKNISDVELIWPYKDCVLEGGQTKEDTKRDEIFWNETLASDEIDRLYDPKVFTEFKRIDKDGEHQLEEFKTNEQGDIKDNLIVKGNNLLALQSLSKEFKSKVKLIYIDPPYNTGSDSFRYNDRFSRSTWLTFMKNRLKPARKMLRQNGALLVQIDYNQAHYLKLLLDEVFGEENFRNEIVWSYRTGGVPETGSLPKKHDLLFLYSKSNEFSFELLKERQYLKKSFMDSKQDEQGRHYVDTNIRDVLEGEINLLEEGEISKIDVRPVLNLSSENVDEFRSQKPEGLLRLMLKLFTNKNDLVMDFFAGSGTTLSSAHKMKRQYIGVEQMSYVDNKLVPRLKEVIKGKDNSGISKQVEWTGGGEFIFMELKDLNQKYIKKIQNEQDKNKLLRIWNDIKENGIISYKLDFEEFSDNYDKFKEADLATQKKFLLEVLDKNQLYVNYSEIDDEKYDIPNNEVELNNKFYNK